MQASIGNNGKHQIFHTNVVCVCVCVCEGYLQQQKKQSSNVLFLLCLMSSVCVCARMRARVCARVGVNACVCVWWLCCGVVVVSLAQGLRSPSSSPTQAIFHLIFVCLSPAPPVHPCLCLLSAQTSWLCQVRITTSSSKYLHNATYKYLQMN